MNELVLSPLGHTWFLDLDGTLVKHNGHLTDGQDSLLPGADALLAEIPADDLVVIVTSRAETYREATERSSPTAGSATTTSSSMRPSANGSLSTTRSRPGS